MKKVIEQKEKCFFRSKLQNKVSVLASDFNQPLMVASLLTEFILALSTHRRGEADFFPAVFVGEDLKDILAVTQASTSISIGSGSKTRENVRRACKLCIPLSDGRDWAVYAVFKSKALKFGIFRANQSAEEATPFEKLRLNRLCANVIGLSRIEENQFRLCNAKGVIKVIKIPYTQEKSIDAMEVIRSLVHVATKDAPANLKLLFESFYSRLARDLVRVNQSLLIAVIPKQKGLPDFFREGILFENKLDFIKEDSISEATFSIDFSQKFSAWNNLILRMAAMDGITVLDSSGAVVGYNYYLKESTSVNKRSNTSVEGVKRRTFEVLYSYLGKQLSGVIYRSEHGILDIGVSDANEN